MSKTPGAVWKEAIMEYSKELKLPIIRRDLEAYVEEALQKDSSYEEFLGLLLQKECDARQETSRYNRVRLAQFTHKKYLEDLSVGDLPEDAQKKLKLLKTVNSQIKSANILTLK